MIVDGHKVERDFEFKTDVCIIGSGPAGLTLAREFAKKDFQVVLLESGGRKFRHPSQWLYIGNNIGRPYFDIVFTRHRMLGGSSYKWSGMCRPLDPIDFEERPWLPYSGWPFGRNELEPYYDRAYEYLQLQSTGFSTENFLLPKQREIKNDQIETKVYQFSPPTDFSEEYADEIAGAGNVKIIYHANVVGIDVNEDGNEVRQVKIATLTRRKFRVSARVFVLACGGIENARLLLVSNKVLKNGLGNQNDLVGRFFNEHVALYFAAISSSQKDTFSGIYKPLDYENTKLNLPPTATFSVKQEVMRGKRLLNARAEIVGRPTYKFGSDYNSLAGVSFTRLAEVLSHDRFVKDSSWRDFIHVAEKPSTVMRIIKDQFKNKSSRNYSIALRLMAETIPNPRSRITLSNKRDLLGMNRINLDWRLTEQDQVSFNNHQKLLIKELRSIGFNLKEIEFELDNTGWPYAIIPGKHHMGATRMHSDPKIGVVDPNCKVHSISNLYIAGSSVFPTSGSANPTFSITALTIRLGDHIKGVMKNLSV